MRVVAGELRGRRLVAPPGAGTRPTSDTVREALFNALESAGLVQGATVFDLFAGSGALGIEALSRGAAECTFVEQDRAALEALRTNVRTLGLGDRATVRAADALRVVTGPHVDLVLADPPYRFERWPEIFAVDAATLVAESDREITAPQGWSTIRARRYGRTFVTILQRIA